MTDLSLPMSEDTAVLLALFWRRFRRSGHLATDISTSQRVAARRIVEAVGPDVRAVVLAAAFAEAFSIDLDLLADDLEDPEQAPFEFLPQLATGRWRVAATAFRYGQAALDEQLLPEAERFFRWTLRQFQVLGNPEAESLALTFVGRVAQMQERLDEAAQCYHQALVLDQAERDFFNVGVDLGLLGQVAWLTRRFDEAEQLCYQALGYFWSPHTHDRHNAASTFSTLKEVAQEQGQYRLARRYRWLRALAKSRPRVAMWLAFHLK